MSEGPVAVTLGGECFRGIFEDKGAHAQARDLDLTIYNLFKLHDLVSDRGQLLINVSFYGAEKHYIRDFDNRRETICWNLIRRGFDQERITFEAALKDPLAYQELKSTANDVDGAPTPAPDSVVRQFVLHKAYWLGFKTSDDPGRFWLEFALPIDLEYLSVTKKEMYQALWYFGQKKVLELQSGAGSVARPTAALVELYEGYLNDRLHGDTAAANKRIGFV